MVITMLMKITYTKVRIKNMINKNDIGSTDYYKNQNIVTMVIILIAISRKVKLKIIKQ